MILFHIHIHFVFELFFIWMIQAVHKGALYGLVQRQVLLLVDGVLTACSNLLNIAFADIESKKYACATSVKCSNDWHILSYSKLKHQKGVKCIPTTSKLLAYKFSWS